MRNFSTLCKRRSSTPSLPLSYPHSWRRSSGSAGQIREYLDDLEKAKYLALAEPELDVDDLDEEGEEELWLENPVMGAEELLRFFRIRQLLQQ